MFFWTSRYPACCFLFGGCSTTRNSPSRLRSRWEFSRLPLAKACSLTCNSIRRPASVCSSSPLLRRELFAHLQSLSLSFHSHARSGETLTNVTSDTNTLKDVLGGNLFDFVGQVVTLVGMFAILFWLNWKLSVAVVFTFPLLVWSIFTMYRRTKLSARAQRHREGKLASHISEVLGSVLLVRAFARESYEQQHFNDESSRALDESVRTARMEGAAARTIEIINSLGVWTCVLFGSLFVLRHEMTPGDVLIFTAYLTSMYKPLRNMAKLSTSLSKASVAAERISAILELDSEPETGAFVPTHGLMGRNRILACLVRLYAGVAGSARRFIHDP